MKTKLLCIVALLLSFHLSVVANNIKGNGKLVTKEISINDYDKISFAGSMQIEYEQKSGKPYLEVTIDENLFPYVDIQVKGKELKIGYKSNNRGGFNHTQYKVVTNSKQLYKLILSGSGRANLKNITHKTKMTVEVNGSGQVSVENVTCDKLNLNQSGSGKIHANNLKADNLNASVGGSGEILLKGTAKDAHYSVGGSGRIKGFNCDTVETDASVSGSGRIEARVNRKLDARVAGSGTIEYKGNNPEVNTSVAGSGRIRTVHD